jgi:hypothetical protein
VSRRASGKKPKESFGKKFPVPGLYFPCSPTLTLTMATPSFTDYVLAICGTTLDDARYLSCERTYCLLYPNSPKAKTERAMAKWARLNNIEHPRPVLTGRIRKVRRSAHSAHSTHCMNKK